MLLKLEFRSRNGLGDQQIFSSVEYDARILPRPNILQLITSRKIDFFNRLMNRILEDVMKPLPVLKFCVCLMGCSFKIGPAESCPVCNTPFVIERRNRKWTEAQAQEKLFKSVVFYFPVTDRLRNILQFDFKNLMIFSKLRQW